MSSTGKYPPIRVGKSPNTRIAPDQQALFDYRIPLHRGAASLVFRVQIKPDPLNTNFYRDPLKKQTDRLRGAIDSAGPEKSLASAFALYSHHESLSVSVTCPLLHRYKVSAVCKD